MLVDVPGFPFLYPPDNDHAGVKVIGEVFELDKALLGRVDQLEGHPAFYTRSLRMVTLDKTEIECWIYIIMNRTPESTAVALEEWPAKERKDLL